MPMPTYEECMLPLLQIVADGQDHKLHELQEQIAEKFTLTDAERSLKLPSGQTSVYASRASWAKTHLKKAGLIEQPSRGIVRITETGQQLLASNPVKIDTKYLIEQFPEAMKVFKDGRSKPLKHPEVEQSQTPQERLEEAHLILRDNLAEELLERIVASSPSFFEQLVVDLLLKMGYVWSPTETGQVVGQVGDGGIDALIWEDKLGLDVVYIQAKRWTSTVPRGTVQAFAGSTQGHRAKKGVMITTSQFSDDAKDYVRYIDPRVVLIDGERLTELMIEHNVGVSVVQKYELKRLDQDYFEEVHG